MNNPYLIFIESISRYPFECEVLFPVDSIFNLINSKETKESRIKDIRVEYNNCFGMSVKNAEIKLAEGVELLQISEEHRTQTRLTQNFFKFNKKITTMLDEYYVTPVVDIVVGKIKRKGSKKKSKKNKKITRKSEKAVKAKKVSKKAKKSKKKGKKIKN